MRQAIAELLEEQCMKEEQQAKALEYMEKELERMGKQVDVKFRHG
jgi:hypothetical protein